MVSKTQPFVESSFGSLSTPSSLPSRYSTPVDAFSNRFQRKPVLSPPYHGIRATEVHSPAFPKPEEQQCYPLPSQSFDTYPPSPTWQYQQHQVYPAPLPATVPSLAFFCRPRRLEEIAPRETISLMITRFFDFVYPLTPCIHKPSFMADLQARREEHDPLFFALVMSTVASTLVQASSTTRC